MTPSLRIVLDTNVVLSGLLFPASATAQALQRAQGLEILASDATTAEIQDVLSRAKFHRYMSRELRHQLASEFMMACEIVPIFSLIKACRDPRDDKFLELAIDGKADLIITGDQDLLTLHPFHGIPIITPTQFLALPPLA